MMESGIRMEVPENITVQNAKGDSDHEYPIAMIFIHIEIERKKRSHTGPSPNSFSGFW
jgi:hypothetical protein